MCESSKLQIILLSSKDVCPENQPFGGTQQNQPRTHHVSVKKIAHSTPRVCRYSDYCLVFTASMCTTFPFSCRLPFTIFTQK